MRDRAWVLVAAVTLSACAAAPPPETIAPPGITPDDVVWYNRIRVFPPPLYSRMYDRMEACTGVEGVEGGFRRLRWSVARGIIERRSMDALAGVWFPGPPRVIGLDFEYVYDPQTVAHEILHDLLDGGNEVHPDPRFVRCIRSVRGW